MIDNSILHVEDEHVAYDVDLRTVGWAMKPEHWAYIFERMINAFGPVSTAAIAEIIVTWHRTLQASIIRWFVEIIVNYSVIYRKNWGGHTDARNEAAVRVAGKIEELMRDEYIPFI